MGGKLKRTLSLTGLFAAFVFLQLSILGLANHAGEGYLPSDRRELVYYGLQVFVLLGYLVYAGLRRLRPGGRLERAVMVLALAGFFAGGVVLLTEKSSPFQLIAAFAAVFCLGIIGGGSMERMSLAAAAGERVALALGWGASAAVLVQFLLGLQWGVTPALPVVMLGAFILLARVLSRPLEAAAPPEAAGEKAPPSSLVLTCLMAAVLLLFASFYNSYIHHLQVATGYTDYNVYTWPRLMFIPGYLLFGAIGDRRGGRLVPVAALCVSLAALLNAVLTGSNGSYWLNMCLFYFALSGAVSYYYLTFWRLAQGTKRPALWASMGRMLDSAMVLLAFVLRLSYLPVAAVLALDVAGLAVLLLLMALGNPMAALSPAPAGPPPQPRLERTLADPEEGMARLQARYSLTDRETDVLRELVRTEDKQTVIAQRLSISPRTVQAHVTTLYQKTGASTRAGLTDLYHDALRSWE